MSGPVVAIGFIFLVPSVIGMIISLVVFLGARSQMMAHDGDTASQVGLLAGEGIALFGAIGSFVGGLLGWLLVMKKRVLQCSLCRAVVNAS